MPHTRKNYFYHEPWSFSNKLLFDVGSTLIITQRESEKQILNKKFYNVSDFKIKKYKASDLYTKVSKRVRFWYQKFKKLQILDWKKIPRVRFWIRNFSTCQILKKCLHSKITFWFILLRQNDIFYYFGVLLKAWFWIENLIKCQILK